jgi:hypothetical protein
MHLDATPVEMKQFGIEALAMDDLKADNKGDDDPVWAFLPNKV